MQRYRVNYRLLSGLVIGFVAAAPVLYFLWSFQVDRNADRLLKEAEYSRSKGDHQEAFDTLTQYVKLRNKDATGFLRLGQAAVALSESDDIDIPTRSKAYFALVETVLRSGAPEAEWTGTAEEVAEKQKEAVKLRRDLVTVHMRYGYNDRALQLIDDLIKGGHQDGELYGLKAQSLFIMQNLGAFANFAYEAIGYNPQTREFDRKPLAPDQTLIYGLLARYLSQQGDTALAERVVEQAITANPDELSAYMIKYETLQRLGKDDDARAALEEAFKRDPVHAAVLRSKGLEAIVDYQKAVAESVTDDGDGEELRKQADDFLQQAADFFSQGIEKYPDDIDFYVQAARIETFRQKNDAALAIIQKGLNKFKLGKAMSASGLPMAIELVNQKVDMLLAKRDIGGVRAEIKALRELKNDRLAPMTDYYEARIEFVNENWHEAARRFADVKTRLIGLPGLQALASAFQGFCHAQLSQNDLAREAYQWALGKNSQLDLALAGLADVESKMGLQDRDDPAWMFDELVQNVLKQSPEQQNWVEVEAKIGDFVRQQAERRGATQTWIDCRIELLKAQMYVSRAVTAKDDAEKARLFVEAKKAIKNAYTIDPADLSVQLAAPRVLMLEQKSGPAEGLKFLDRMIAENQKRGIAETLPFRLLRVDLLYALRDEQVAAQLHAATEGMETWVKSQQAEVWAAVAGRFDQLGKFDDAELCLKEAIKLAPASLPYRVSLFELARKQADDAGMRAAQKGILEVVKSEDAPDYVLTEVKRLIVNVATGSITAEELKPARTLIDNAIRLRPNWAELYVLSGQLAMVLEKNPTLALKNLRSALEHGPSNLNALNLQIRLLADQGQFVEARRIMDRLPEAAWTSVLDRTAANVLRNVGELDKAFQEGKKLADANPNDGQLLAWYAEIAAQAKEFAAAETAFKAAIALDPSDADMWSGFLTFYMQQNKGDEVERTLRQAQLALDEEYLTLLTAQQHRLFGRFGQAESIFVSSYGNRLDQLPVVQRMAEFYLGWGEQDPAYRAKAAPYLNRILRAANEGKAQPTDAIVAWARGQAARLLSLSGDYQDSIKAEKLLVSAMADSATPDGEAMLVDILNRRGDPASRERAITLLQRIQKQRGLPPHYELLLGEALNGIGQWAESQRQMEAAITRFPDNVALRVGLIEMLIDHQELAAAKLWMDRLNSVRDSQPAMVQLRIRLAEAQGDKNALRQMLERITPNLSVLNADQLKLVYSVSLLADEAGDHEYALKLMKEFAGRVPGHELELARFTAMYGDLDEGMAMLARLFPSDMDTVVSVAVEVLRARRQDAPEKLDEQVNLLVRQARRDDPDAARRMVLEAESFEVQQRFDEAIAAYNRILARDDVPKFVRASALNNLAFLLAMQKQDLDKGLERVNEAMAILGPLSDILDTRALVYLHRGEPQKAVEDLQLAVKMGATANKYFHLTSALLNVGDEAGALEAWKQAEAKGISVEKVPDVEREDLEQLMQKIEALRSAAGQS